MQQTIEFDNLPSYQPSMNLSYSEAYTTGMPTTTAHYKLNGTMIQHSFIQLTSLDLFISPLNTNFLLLPSSFISTLHVNHHHHRQPLSTHYRVKASPRWHHNVLSCASLIQVMPKNWLISSSLHVFSVSLDARIHVHIQTQDKKQTF